MPRSPSNLQANPIRPFFSFGLQGGPGNCYFVFSNLCSIYIMGSLYQFTMVLLPLQVIVTNKISYVLLGITLLETVLRSESPMFSISQILHN